MQSIKVATFENPSMDEIDRMQEEELRAALPPEGEYEFRVTDCKLSVSKSSGKDMLEMKLEIRVADHKSKVFYFGSLGLKGIKYTYKFLENIGRTDLYMAGKISERDAYELNGLTGKANFEHEFSEGYGWQCKVGEFINAPESAPVNVDGGPEDEDCDIPF